VLLVFERELRLLEWHCSAPICKTLVLVVGSCLFVGCGESRPPNYPVSGQVVLKDGTTLKEGGRVVFMKVGSQPAVRANGYFGPDGKFELTTYPTGDGVPAGDYEVMVVPSVPDDQGDLSEREYIKAMEPIDSRYQNPKGSGLRFTVSPETAPHEFRIEVTRPRRRR